MSTNCASQYYLSTLLEHLRGHHIPGQPVLLPDHSFCEEILPSTHPDLPLAQLEAITSCPIAVAWEKRLTLTLPQPPFR